MNTQATPMNRPGERAALLRLDPVILLLAAAILLLGLVMVTSASVTTALAITENAAASSFEPE